MADSNELDPTETPALPLAWTETPATPSAATQRQGRQPRPCRAHWSCRPRCSARSPCPTALPAPRSSRSCRAAPRSTPPAPAAMAPAAPTAPPGAASRPGARVWAASRSPAIPTPSPCTWYAVPIRGLPSARSACISRRSAPRICSPVSRSTCATRASPWWSKASPGPRASARVARPPPRCPACCA